MRSTSPWLNIYLPNAALHTDGNHGPPRHLPSRPHVSARLPISSNSPSNPANNGSTPMPRTTLASRTLRPIQSSPLRVSLDRTPRMRGTARLDPSARRRASPPVAVASGAITAVVEGTSLNSLGLAGPPFSSGGSLPRGARPRPRPGPPPPLPPPPPPSASRGQV